MRSQGTSLDDLCKHIILQLHNNVNRERVQIMVAGALISCDTYGHRGEVLAILIAE